MKLLELFAGSKSIGRVALDLGYEVCSSDSEPFYGIDYIVDILEFDYKEVPFIPDVIWASPPCESFSVASIGKHWNRDHTPKTERAVYGLSLVEKTIEIIAHYQQLNPKLIWYIENPRGKLRKLIPNMLDDRLSNLWINRTVTYCRYGDDRMKPTDIWTNNQAWVPRPVCRNGADCHVPAPRGSRTGTQGRATYFERSKIPPELCLEVLTQAKGGK